MDKQKTIEAISELPDDIEVFFQLEGDFDDIHVVIFTKPKDQKFIEWYFGP